MFKKNQVVGIDKAIRGINNLVRWTEFWQNPKFNELAKQALNIQIVYLLAKFCEAKDEKMQIYWEAFPKIAIFRCFEKIGLADVTYCTYSNIVEKKMNKNLDTFFSTVGKKNIQEMVGDPSDVDNLIDFLDGVRTTNEYKLFRVASRIASLIELIEIKKEMSQEKYAEIYSEILGEIKGSGITTGIEEFVDCKGPIMRILRKLPLLRNQNRWAVQSARVNCSVLGHEYDTAVFAYLLALENGYSQKEATKCFFLGAFHDSPETWTKDIRSITKDAFEGFRQASEEYELECVQKEIYDIAPEWAEKAIKEVMMEDKGNASYKKLLKTADYVSACSECHRQLVGGSNDVYFRNVILNEFNKFTSDENTYLKGAFLGLLEKFVADANSLRLLD